jgi:hypothetical protein
MLPKLWLQLSILLWGVCFQLFTIFLLAFGRSKNWLTQKVRSWKHLSMSFSASRFLDHPTFGSFKR